MVQSNEYFVVAEFSLTPNVTMVKNNLDSHFPEENIIY